MACLFRLITVALLLLTGASAYATVPKVNGFAVAKYGNVGGSGVVFPSFESACVSAEGEAVGKLMVQNAGRTFVRMQFVADPLGCRAIANVSYEIVGINTVANVCPANSTSVTGGCQCTSPYVENAAKTACEAPPDPCLAIKGSMVGEIEWASVSKGNNYSCLGGEGQLASCQTVAVCDYTSQVPGQSGYTCRGISYATGGRASMCTGNGESADGPSPAPVKDPLNPDKLPSPGQPAPARCPAGQAPGEFNGARICAPTGSGTQTSTPAPGNGSTTVNNSDGSSTTSTQTGRTTCQQGQCTTTTNVTNVTTNAAGNNTCPSGQTSGTTTVGGQTRTTCTGTGGGSSTQAQSGFCEKNPKDKQCDGDGSDTSFGGTCAGGFKAQSDNAVVNAMAEEQHKRNCKFFGEPDSQPKEIPKQTKTAVLGTVTVAGWGSSCPAPITVAAMGETFQLSFQSFCDTAPMVRPIVLLICALLSMSIVYSALRGNQ